MQQGVVDFMESLQLVLLVFQVIIAISLISLILIQHGKGADAGAAFGSGASSTMFGSQGSGNFLTKTTAVLAFLFLSNSLMLGYMATQRVADPTSIMTEAPVVIEDESIITESELLLVEDESSAMESEAMTAEETTKEEAIKTDIPSVEVSESDVPSTPKDSIPRE